MKTKKLTTNHPVPQNSGEANEMIAELGQVRRDLARAEAAMNDDLAAVKNRHEDEARPLKDRAEALLGGIEMWANANRAMLTLGGKVKFARFGAGEIKWRTRPPRVTIRAQEAVIEALRGLGLTRFIRVKEEVNREALLNEPEAAAGIKGIAIGSEGEDFVVEPFEEELAKGGAA